MRRLPTLFPTLLALAMVAGASNVQAAPVIGRPAPALAGSTLSGQPFDLAALRGKVVILNAWATWCAPCRAEMPALDAFQRRYASRGVVVLGLSTDKPEAAPMVARLAGGLSYPTLMAAYASANGFGAPSAVPATVVIGADGVVRDIVSGESGLLTEARLAALVEPLLARRPAL